MPESTTILPPPAATTPSTPPSASGNLPSDVSIDFSQFEAARDLTPTPPPATTAAVSTSGVSPNTTDKPVVPPAMPQTPPAPTPTPVPTHPNPTPPPPVPVPLQPVVVVGVDKDGKPLVPEIDLTQSAFNGNQQTPKPGDATPTPSNLPDVEDGRDMKGFNEEERKAFRKMSNEAFNFLSPKYREAKSLQPTIETLKQDNEKLKQQVQQAPNMGDANVTVNPNGFIFTPEFAQLTQHEQNHAFEANYWQEQLALLRSGKNPKALAWNGQQYVAGREMQPDANTEAFINNNLIQANMNKQTVQQQQRQLQVGWQVQAQNDLQTIKRTEDAYFPWFVDGKQHSFQPIIDGFVKQLPLTQRGNPLGRALGKAYAVIQHLQNELGRAKTSVSTAPTSTSNQGPLAVSAPPSIPTSSGDEDLMKQFEMVKRS